MGLGRLYRIIKTFYQYQLDKVFPEHWLPWYAKYGRILFPFSAKVKDEDDNGKRIRLALQELGPVFIKFGQMLSTRRDLLPDDVANELAFLQDQVDPFDGRIAQKIIEESLGVDDIHDVFVDFEQTALASASIAQVHKAKIDVDGVMQDVVIKVLRPEIEPIIKSDLELLRTLAKLGAKLLPDGKRLRPVEVVEEYRKQLDDELDLLREAANTLQLKRNFTDSELLYVPQIYSDYGRKNMLVMEFIDGIPVSDIDALEAQNTNLALLAERGVETFFTQVFRDSFFHADMHPGNIFVSKQHPDNPQWIAIDCGIVGSLNPSDKRYLAENFIAFFNRDYYKVAELHVDSGWVPADTNVEEFEVAIRTVCEPIFQKPLDEISFGQVLMHLFATARRFNMEVQPQLVLMQKTLLYIEGLGRQLYPQLDLWATAKPFLENWMKDQIGPKAMFKAIKEKAPFWGEKLPEMPDLIYDNLLHMKRTQISMQQFYGKYAIQQRLLRRTITLNLTGAALLISAALLWPDKDMATMTAIAGAVFIAIGWQGRK